MVGTQTLKMCEVKKLSVYLLAPTVILSIGIVIELLRGRDIDIAAWVSNILSTVVFLFIVRGICGQNRRMYIAGLVMLSIIDTGLLFNRLTILPQ